jgi:hypothetical protein
MARVYFPPAKKRKKKMDKKKQLSNGKYAGISKAKLSSRRAYFTEADAGNYTLRVVQMTDGDHEIHGEFFGADFEVVSAPTTSTKGPGSEVSIMLKPNKFRSYFVADVKSLLVAAGLPEASFDDENAASELIADAGGAENPLAGRLILARVVNKQDKRDPNRVFTNVYFSRALNAEDDAA